MIRQQVYRERVDFEKVDPLPVAVLGPVPSIKEQMTELMRDPRWLIQQMKLRQEEEQTSDVPVEGIEVDDDNFEDDEPDWFTGYQLHEMQPILIPEDKPETEGTPEVEALMGDSDKEELRKPLPEGTITE